MKNDLLIMLRVLILGLFIWATFVFAKAFVVLFWVLIAILFVVGWREAKQKENQRISDAMDELREMRKVGDELREMQKVGDEFPEPHMDYDGTPDNMTPKRSVVRDEPDGSRDETI